MQKEYHLDKSPILAGQRIYEARLDVAGVFFRKAQVQDFVRGRDHALKIVLEKTNVADRNAMAIYASWRGWLFKKTAHIGYVPREISERLAHAGLCEIVEARLLKTYEGHDGFVEVGFQIIGPAELYSKYKPDLSVKAQVRVALNEGSTEAIEAQILAEIQRNEDAAAQGKGGVPALPYKTLMQMYRKQKRKQEEEALLVRFGKQPHARGKQQDILRERYENLISRNGSD